MAEAGLIEALDASASGDFDWRPTSLTWQGHEFLDAVRNDTVWRKTMALVKEKGGSVPFDVVNPVRMRALPVAATESRSYAGSRGAVTRRVTARR